MTGAVPNPLNDPTAVALTAGDLEAVFLPGHGMLGISLRRQGIEFLRQIDDLKTAATSGAVAGIPLLFPWANRLAGFRYEAAGRTVTLPQHSPLMRYDNNGLPMHGMPWPHLTWTIVERAASRLIARLDWSSAEHLSVFPYPCRLLMTASLDGNGLTIETALTATGGAAVPVSFGFHPYLGLPELSREDWRVHIPPMRHLALDPSKIPTGAAEPFGGLEDALGDRDFDDGFALLGDRVTLSVAGGGWRVSVDLLDDYPYAQVYAPRGHNYLAFEPMTAPSNALVSGKGLHLAEPGGTFRAAFRIRIGADT
ncbi:MAG: aldose 1-epimerase [Methyloceanibacter sp.]|uniref:aldose 1-epimerase n=1 Tax=Methyloceanibacter sp. TaxID=1965321 RepID=UPI003D6D2698